MRITENILTEKYLYNQSIIKEKLLKTQIQLSTNNKLQKLTDNLSDSLEVIRLDTQVRRSELYLKNIDNSLDFIEASTRALDNVTVEVQRIISNIVNVSNPINDKNITTVGLSIKSSLEAIVNSLNEKHNGMYLFGGTDFTDSPWSVDINGKAQTTTVDFSGEMKVQLTDNVKETINIPGNKIQDTNLLQTINDIIDSFDAGNVPDQALLDRLMNSYNEIISVQSLAGEKFRRMDDISVMMKNNLDNRTVMLAKKVEVDPAELAVELQYQDYLLQLSYKMASAILPKSILDYL